MAILPILFRNHADLDWSKHLPTAFFSWEMPSPKSFGDVWWAYVSQSDVPMDWFRNWCGSTDRNAEFSWGYDGPMPQTREHILLSRQVGVFGTLNDGSQLSRWVDLPFWMAPRGIKSENFVGSRSINCIMMTCHATFVAQGENIVLWTICLLVFVCVQNSAQTFWNDISFVVSLWDLLA